MSIALEVEIRHKVSKKIRNGTIIAAVFGYQSNDSANFRAISGHTLPKFAQISGISRRDNVGTCTDSKGTVYTFPRIFASGSYTFPRFFTSDRQEYQPSSDVERKADSKLRSSCAASRPFIPAVLKKSALGSSPIR